jgi:hypothetical protein
MVKVMAEYKINYETSYRNNFRTDVKSAVKFYLELSTDFKYSTDQWGGFILYPQALNPFLKIMESLGESRNIIIVPGFDNDEGINKPAYLILKLDLESQYPISILTESKIAYKVV